MAKKFKFGDRVRNIYASDDNPIKHSIFVRIVKRTGKMNPGVFAKCTDGEGRFWLVDLAGIEHEGIKE